MGDDTSAADVLRDYNKPYRWRRRAGPPPLLWLALALSLAAAIASVRRATREGPARTPEDLAEVSSETWVRVDLVFAGDTRFSVTRPRFTEVWPDVCAQCGRRIELTNGPLLMWSGQDGRRCFTGCFGCWKELMRGAAADLKNIGFQTDVALETSAH